MMEPIDYFIARHGQHEDENKGLVKTKCRTNDIDEDTDGLTLP